MITTINHPSKAKGIIRRIKCPFCYSRLCDSTMIEGTIIVIPIAIDPPPNAVLLKCHVCGNTHAIFIEK